MVDLSFLEKFTKGDTRKMKRYITIYLNVAPGTFEQMQQHVIDQDWKQLCIKAHSLKPQADYMGIPQLKAALVEMEQSVQKATFEKLPPLFARASAIHMASVPFLKAFIDASENGN